MRGRGLAKLPRHMSRSRLAPLLFAALNLVACQSSVSNGGSGSENSGEGGSAGSAASGGTAGAGGDTTSSTDTGTTTEACDTPNSPPAFEVGTGEKCFERLTADQEVPLMSGPQGGYHMWLAAGCVDCGTVVHLEYGARDPATHMPLTGTYDEQAMVQLYGKEWPQAAGLIVHMPGLSWDPENEPPPAKGTKLLLWAEAYDPDGNLWHSMEVPVTVGDIVDWNPCVENPNDPLCQTG